MTMPHGCAVAVVLDRSGSMESIRQATIEGFNEFLAGQKAVGGPATFTLVQFDHEYEVVHDAQPLAGVPALTAETYQPRGSTALLDAIGRAINTLGAKLAAMPEPQRPDRVLFAIITDGMENASQEFTRKRIFEMITHQRERYSWEFMFLAANQDAIASGRGMGVDVQYSASFSASQGASRKMFRMASEKFARSRSSAEPTAPFSAAERADLMSDEPTDSAPKSPNIRPPRRRGRASGSGAPQQPPAPSST